MVAKVFNQGVCPVWVLGPLDVGGAFGLWSERVAINNGDNEFGFCGGMVVQVLTLPTACSYLTKVEVEVRVEVSSSWGVKWGSGA